MPPSNPLRLTAAEARALGSLMEKEVTTPEYYPLSLNALINACNQRSNREPVMNLDEDDVRQALHGLEDKGLAGRARSSEGRVTKYEHWLGEAFNFSRAEAALVCVLLLRGPQTPGELRGRCERMHLFEEHPRESSPDRFPSVRSLASSFAFGTDLLVDPAGSATFVARNEPPK